MLPAAGTAAIRPETAWTTVVVSRVLLPASGAAAKAAISGGTQREITSASTSSPTASHIAIRTAGKLTRRAITIAATIAIVNSPSDPKTETIPVSQSPAGMVLSAPIGASRRSPGGGPARRTVDSGVRQTGRARPVGWPAANPPGWAYPARG